MMGRKLNAVAAAATAAVYCLAPTAWHALAAQDPPVPPTDWVPSDPLGPPPPQGAPSPPTQPPAQQYPPAPPPPQQQQQGYHQQPPAGGYAAAPQSGHYGYAQDAQQQQPQPPPYYGGDQRYAQQPPSYQQAASAYQQQQQQGYQPPPAYQQHQPPPAYQPPPQPQYGQPPPPPPPQQQQPPPQYYQSPPPPQQQRQQQQDPPAYQPPPPQHQGGAQQQSAQKQQQQQTSRGAQQQQGDTKRRQQQQQPTQQRQQPTKAEQRDSAPKQKTQQKQQKQQKQKATKPVEDLVFNEPEMPIDEMTPEYQPRREEEGGIVDNDQQTATLMEEWEKHMQNFIPDMLVTFSLGARSDEYFYEAIDGDSVFLRGGFFVGGEEGDSAVDFSITDPDGDIIYKKSRSEGLFYFTAKKKGTYSFILSNHRWMESKTVTFAIGRGSETALLPKHLNNAEEMAAQLERQLKDIQAESSYLWIRQRSLNDAAQGFLQRLSWLSGIEFLMLIATAAFHARYIVGLVSDKRIL